MPAFLIKFANWLTGGFLFSLLGSLARFLLSGVMAQIIVKVVLYFSILGAVFLFYKNFAATSLDYALSFFSFFGFADVVNQIQYYFNQLPPSLIAIFSFFEVGSIVAFLINNYISSVFLAWVMRRFG